MVEVYTKEYIDGQFKAAREEIKYLRDVIASHEAEITGLEARVMQLESSVVNMELDKAGLKAMPGKKNPWQEYKDSIKGTTNGNTY